jgi:hypothetical protein
MAQSPGKLASLFGLLDASNYITCHLLFSMEYTNLFANQFVPGLVPVRHGPSRIDELNDSVEVEHNNSLPPPFSDRYQMPQRPPDLFMDSNYILHMFIDFAKEAVILIFAKRWLGKQDS